MVSDDSEDSGNERFSFEDATSESARRFIDALRGALAILAPFEHFWTGRPAWVVGLLRHALATTEQELTANYMPDDDTLLKTVMGQLLLSQVPTQNPALDPNDERHEYLHDLAWAVHALAPSPSSLPLARDVYVALTTVLVSAVLANDERPFFPRLRESLTDEPAAVASSIFTSAAATSARGAS